MSARIPTLFRLLLIFVLTLTLLTVAVPVQAQEPETLPLAERGPYLVGTLDVTYSDEARDGRDVAVTVWYPAADEIENAAADTSAAPYPLILYTVGMFGQRRELHYLTEHLASHGFVVAGLERAGGMFSYTEALDQPLDVLFVLDRLAEAPPPALAGVIDAEHAGVTGYSFGGYSTVAVSGAQWDDLSHWTWCNEHASEYPSACPGPEIMDMVAEYRAQREVLPEEGELWPPLTDARIRAVLPLAGAPGMVFGDRGLAAAEIPMLMMAATADQDVPYEPASAFVYENWGDDQHTLISFVGARHNFGYTSVNEVVGNEIQHFSTAFFGRYLQNHEEYADYLTADSVNALENLYWGVYPGTQ